MSKFIVAESRASRRNLPVGQIFSMLGDLEQYAQLADKKPGSKQSTSNRFLIIEADPAEVKAKSTTFDPNVLVEAEILHHPQNVNQRRIIVTVTGGGKLLRGVAVSVVGYRLHAGTSTSVPSSAAIMQRDTMPDQHLAGVTDHNGEARISVAEDAKIVLVIATPYGGHWQMVRKNPSDDEIEIECPVIDLPSDGLGWWHRELGLASPDANLGSGVKVGVADTGFGTHGWLDHVTDVGSWNDNTHDRSAGSGRDIDSHGTHVCGLIGARRSNTADGFIGIAPATTLYSARVFRSTAGASQEDIAGAILWLAEKNEVDLINLSLGSPARSQILLDAIADAADMGTLCVAAAGNSAGEVLWPAQDGAVIAVTALGRPDAYPVGSHAAEQMCNAASRDAGGGLRFAKFSCSGPQIECCAPGVGVVSCSPDAKSGVKDRFTTMSGTSMATPLVVGTLAGLLSKSSDFANSARTDRPALARELLRRACRANTLNSHLQGRGMPVL